MSAKPTLSDLGLQEPVVAVPPPVDTNSVVNFDPGVVAQDALDTRIIIHSRFPDLVQRFLDHKRVHGSTYEKALYTDSWTWQQQVTRLIAMRPLVFMGSGDFTVCRDGTYPRNPSKEWDRVGTAAESKNQFLSLQEYLSYDEMMLGSLVGVSGPSFFINNGCRDNYATLGKSGTFEPRGIIIGLVGARFERPDRMDSVHILRRATNPRQHPELTQIFEQFFGSARDERARFDIPMYKARMRIPIDMLLLEANERAEAAGKDAYVYVVGLGLGVWQFDSRQTTAYVECFVDALVALASKLTHIATIDFAWITVHNATRRLVEGVVEPLGIAVKFTQRNPAARLVRAEQNQLLVLSYAWDSNAFPGNEYWQGGLGSSGDPAAACMSTIGQLHNPLYNPGFLQRITVLDATPDP
ncbi:hypothetical protein F5X99DRAFT_45771 [Biscogniauxia marginata]|nr:hypothetical protein F5X99DRAFT_45771 [Biscogniauxia marginata]